VSTVSKVVVPTHPLLFVISDHIAIVVLSSSPEKTVVCFLTCIPLNILVKKSAGMAMSSDFIPFHLDDACLP
jgi:hypothetical protein